MTIIDQLDQTVTTAVLGNNNNVAHVSLLEQFYAIFIARLAQPDVYTQLLHADQNISVPATLSPEISSITMFEQLWQKASLRQWLIDELATSHHVDTQTTQKLLINAASLIYQELNILANGQFLPAFLQTQQLSVRSYLPVWAEKVIVPKDTDNDAINLDKQPLLVDTTDTIYANPSDYRDSETSESRLKGRTRNPRNNLIVKVLLFIGALTAIGLAWILVIKPNYLTPASAPVEPVVTSPVAVEPISEPAVETLLPVELLIVIDDSGDVYNCTATVGDTALQKALKQALNVSFGEQASTCELEVKPGVAKRLSNIDIEALPRVFTLLRSVPFARLQLQNAELNLEAPDGILLQRLLTDIRTIIPTATITSAAPLSLANSDEIIVNNDNDISMMNNRDNQFVNENMPLNNTYDDTYPKNNDLQNNDMSFNQNAQQSSDVTNNTIEAIPYNSNANKDINSQPNNDRSFTTSGGSMSTAEVDDLANTTIVAEKLRNERPVDKELIRDK
ncbi:MULTISPECIES: hypothetical protein [unclassified Psychrobacter]|uniref:hypothetical protein n=1 Tax=unclassified Psychrobacter TaxID=196806 RepID=UPI00071E9C48|nr:MULTISPECIES: hypothetical protein [unclassified Psychrobacter]OLF37017.1 hypothetical protein BTV98_08860 [Psychrobacter sp. Cmf 22.2]